MPSFAFLITPCLLPVTSSRDLPFYTRRVNVIILYKETWQLLKQDAEKLLPSLLSSDMVLNGLVSLEFSSLGIQMPSGHLHWSATLPLCHITLRIFQSCRTDSWTAFVHAVQYPPSPLGSDWSSCLNDFLDRSQVWFLDVQLSCWESWALFFG